MNSNSDSPQLFDVDYRGAAKNCSRCAAPFKCGVALDTCWCNRQPHLDTARLDANADCLCPQCLGDAIESVSLAENANQEN